VNQEGRVSKAMPGVQLPAEAGIFLLAITSRPDLRPN